MVATMLGNGTIDMQPIGRDEATNIIGGEIKETLNTILLPGLQGDAALAFQQGIGGPGGAPKDTGSIGAGGHGVKVLVELSRRNFLGLIHREKQIGSCANHFGTGFAGKELEASLAKLIDVALGRSPKMARADTGIQGMTDAIHVVEGLGLEGRRNGDDAPADASVTKEKPGEEMSLELILAGLTREDNDESEAAVIKDGIFNGEGDLDLIGTKMNLAGMRPVNGAAAEGLPDGEGEDGWGREHLLNTKDTKYHEGNEGFE